MDIAKQYPLKNLLEKSEAHKVLMDGLLNEFLNEFISESFEENDDRLRRMFLNLNLKSPGNAPSHTDHVTGQEQNDLQGRSNKANSTNCVMPSTTEEQNNCNHSNTSQLDSTVANGGDKKGREQSADYYHQSAETVSVPSSKDGRLRQHIYDTRESSFSAMSSLPPGSLAYCRNDSTRSDSSTTSGQSFAFPILNPEWTSSPVKLIKSDQRHVTMIKKRRSRWRSFFCCTF